MPENEEAQVIRIRAIAKQALKEAIEEIVLRGTTTEKADKLLDTFVDIVFNQGREK